MKELFILKNFVLGFEFFLKMEKSLGEFSIFPNSA